MKIRQRTSRGAVIAGLALALSGACAAAAPAAQVKVLYGFDGAKDGDGGPDTELLRASDGLFYGATCCAGKSGYGTIYSTDLHGRTRTLHALALADGIDVNGPLVQAPDGNFYGSAFSGGDTTAGTLFRLAADGTFTVLHAFTGEDGENPLGGLVLASDGALYGTTTAGGKHGGGVLFRMSLAGDYARLHDFGDVGSDPRNPVGVLLETAGGAMVGVTETGGAHHAGTVFRLGADGMFGTVVDFAATGTGPRSPREGLVDGRDGWLYGTTMSGGEAGGGTVYRLKLDGTIQTLHGFAGAPADGATPKARLLLASDGEFYGVTVLGGGADLGVAFRITHAGDYAVLHDFSPADGDQLQSALAQASAGTLVGAATRDGPAAHGDTYLLKLH